MVGRNVEWLAAKGSLLGWSHHRLWQQLQLYAGAACLLRWLPECSWLAAKPTHSVHAACPDAQDHWGSDALMMAAAQGHAAAVQLLLRQGGADPAARDCQERTALHAVALWGTYTVMVNSAILAPHDACRGRGAAVCARLLLEAGADVDAVDE